MKFAILIAAVGMATLSLSGLSTAAPNPADEQNIVPPVIYQSPFRDYRPIGEDQPIPWKAANDEVRRIGGWRVYAKEAQDGTASANPAAPATPAPVTSLPGKPADAATAPNTTPPPVKPPVNEPAVKPVPGHGGHGEHK